MLRIEDLDTTRVKPGATDLVLEDMAWLGLDWDGDPLFQTERRAPHQSAIDELLDKGLAYPCVCTRGEIHRAARAPHADEEETPYPGTCRGRFTSPQDAESKTGRTPAIRLAVTPGPVPFHDLLRGPQSFDVAALSGDFVIGRKDGMAAYQLATPLDDAHQQVTEVIRGDDLLSSAARQRLVLDALNLPFPAQAHIPLVAGQDGQRLAKRAGSLSLQELRESGTTPESIATWAASTIGLTAIPRVSIPAPAEAWTPQFRLQSVPKAGLVRTPPQLPSAL